MTHLISVPIILGISAFALSTAEMKLPPDFALQAERHTIAGFGGHNKGRFNFDRYHGEFTRGESRFSIKDTAFVSNKGKSSFTLRNSDGQELASASCVMRKNAVTIGIVTFDPKKLSYQCEFASAGQSLGTRLVLGQPKAVGTKEKLFAKDLRRGEARLFDQHLLVDSVHHYKGSKFQSPAAVGYLIMNGEQLVAAVELTDVNPTLLVLPGIDEELQRSVLATALALAVFRDPADSALEDPF